MSESTMTTDEWGNKVWKNSRNYYHRTDGPAIEWSDGDKEWWLNGMLHRLNGPAVDRPNRQLWYMNGKYLGSNDEGFWALWERLTDEQKKDPILLTYLPGDFHV